MRWPIRWPALPRRGPRDAAASWICWALGHPAALWESRERGLVWICPVCRRFHLSEAFRDQGDR